MLVVADPAWRNRRANPYNALLYDAVVRAGAEVRELRGADPTTASAVRADALHVHWPDAPWGRRVLPQAYASAAGDLRIRARFRRLGTPVVWTAHNAWAHGGHYPRSERLWWRAWQRQVDGWVALSDTARDVILREHPALADLPHAVIPHGHYREAYERRETAEQTRHRLGLRPDRPLLGFVGRIKAYKGLPELVRTFRDVADPELQLLVAGRADDRRTLQEVTGLAAGDPRITLRAEEVAEADLADVVGALDVAVLPYRAVLNSGTALLALSFGTPVLLPEGPAATELARSAPGWVRTYRGDLTSEVLRALGDLSKPPEPPALADLSWDRIAAAHLDFFRTLRGTER